MDRRHFLKQTTVAGISAACISQASNAKPESFPKRLYGDTGIELSIIGFGGIVVDRTEQSHANKTVAKAFDNGINYFDVAPTYGIAEDRLGPALEPYRDNVFLACKTQKRDKQGAEAELISSLKKLRTDHFDLYQLHALSKMEDLEKALAPGGALETFTKAKEKGLIRYIGFSAHSAEVAIAALDQFDFDSILFPFNYVTWFEGDFGPQVIKKAKEKNAACLALKAMAHTRRPRNSKREKYPKCWYLPVTDSAEAEKALRFTLSLDITAAIPPGDESLFWQGVKFARHFKPLGETEKDEIRQLAKGVTPIFRREA